MDSSPSRRRTLLSLVMGAALIAPACHGPYDRHHHHHGGEVVADIVTTVAVTAAFVALWHGFCNCCHHVSYVVVRRY